MEKLKEKMARGEKEKPGDLFAMQLRSNIFFLIQRSKPVVQFPVSVV